MRRYFTSYLMGAMGALAMPPVFAFPLLAVMMTGWFSRLEQATNKRQAFLHSWLVGLGYFTVGLYWVCISLTVDVSRFGWLIPFALIGLNGLIALFYGFAGLAYHRFKRGEVQFRLLCFVGLVFLAEFARGHVLTGFPWNLAAHTWAFSAFTLQSVYYIGTYGLTLLTLAVAALPALGKRKALLGFGVFAAIMAACGMRYVNAPAPAFVEGVKLRLVQPNIPQDKKWDEASAKNNFNTLAALSADESATHILWPEAALPMPIEAQDGEGLANALRLSPTQTLIAGALFVEGEAIMNSLVAVTAQGTQAVYHKHHLVPFGEYVPLRSVLPIEKIVPGFGDLSAGKGPQTLALEGLPPFSPLICYEVIFPQHATDDTGRARWLLSVTNDAWFGLSSGPYQHFYIARMRAVEAGLPLVRVANTGISGVVDAYGRILARTSLGKQATLSIGLPKAP